MLLRVLLLRELTVHQVNKHDIFNEEIHAFLYSLYFYVIQIVKINCQGFEIGR